MLANITLFLGITNFSPMKFGSAECSIGGSFIPGPYLIDVIFFDTGTLGKAKFDGF